MAYLMGTRFILLNLVLVQRCSISINRWNMTIINILFSLLIVNNESMFGIPSTGVDFNIRITNN